MNKKGNTLIIAIVIIILMSIGLYFLSKVSINDTQIKDNETSNISILKETPVEAIKKPVSNFLPKTNYTCEEIIPEKIIISNMWTSGYFKNGVEIRDDYHILYDKNCIRDTEVGSNIHHFNCYVNFWVTDNLDPDGTITENSYGVYYSFSFDDRNCTDFINDNPRVVYESNPLYCSYSSYECFWEYKEPPKSSFRLNSIAIEDLQKTI